MKPSAKNTTTLAALTDWLDERQQQAQQKLSDFRRDSEEIDATIGKCEKEFESLMNRVRTDWEDALRMRSNENDKRQLLESVKARIQNILAETDQSMTENKKLEEHKSRIDHMVETMNSLEKLKE